MLFSVCSALKDEILWTIQGPRKTSRLSAISTFSSQVAAFYESRAHIIKAREPMAVTGNGATPVTMPTRTAAEEMDAKIRILKTRHPQALRREHDLEMERTRKTYPDFTLTAFESAERDESISKAWTALPSPNGVETNGVSTDTGAGENGVVMAEPILKTVPTDTDTDVDQSW